MERLGVSQAVVGGLELGEHNPRMETLLLLAERLGLAVELKITPPPAVELQKPQVNDFKTASGGSLRIVA